MKRFRPLIWGCIVVILLLLGLGYAFEEEGEVAGVPILNYHMVDDGYENPLVMNTKDFEEQMKYLKEAGYHTINSQQLYAYLYEGAELPDKPIMITFDDGYADNYTKAYPIMKKYGFTGTIFVITDTAVHTEQGRYLSWEQIEEMGKDGFSFESHTVNHKDLTKVTPEALAYELQQSKMEMEEHLGKLCRMIAYPEGEYNKRVIQATKEAGYALAFTIDIGRVHRGDNPFLLPRIPVFEGDNALGHLKFRLWFTTVTKDLWSLRNYLRDTWHLSWMNGMPLP